MDLIGQTVEGRYAITYRLHVGGTATVYLAYDQFLRRSVVLKVLHPSLAANPASVERFRREACIAAALNHPILISVYNVGAYAGTYYIVMEHVTGPSLSEALRVGGRIAEVRALQITAHVAAALAAAHERGVVHGDIRSHNILLAAGGQVRITDFSCAATTGICVPDAAPPTPINGQADLYNLGLVLREMLTGMPTMAANALSPSAWARLRLSPATDALVWRALAPNSAARFPTADALRVVAEGALSQIAMGSSQPGRLRALSGRVTAHAGGGQPRIGLAGLFRVRSTRLAS